MRHRWAFVSRPAHTVLRFHMRQEKCDQSLELSWDFLCFFQESAWELMFRLTADVWRPGGCRLFAVVCHNSVHVTQPETEPEARCIATMCFSVCILLGTKQAVEHMWESGSHWYIFNVTDNCEIKRSMGNRGTSAHCTFSLGEPACQPWNAEAQTNISKNIAWTVAWKGILGTVWEMNQMLSLSVSLSVGAELLVRGGPYPYLLVSNVLHLLTAHRWEKKPYRLNT